MPEPKGRTSTIVPVRIPLALKGKLIARAQRRGQSINAYVKWCIEQQVDRKR